MLYTKILNKNQLELIKKLDFLGEGVYLAGGTALAIQLGHRTSLDFDFYSKKVFDPQKLSFEFQRRFKDTKVNRIADGTLILRVNTVDFSMFHYPYELIEKRVYLKGVRLASIPDISAMKLIAIAMRGKRRDFIDIYYLLQRYPLSKLLKFAEQKYPNFETLMILKGLIFFKDAENEEIARGIRVFEPNFSWEEAKKSITNEVKKYQLAMLK
ncbi:MAG: nucleotidyl transferase AbiEii/AbiGii toxin family protein [bacterium]|nr:nucleotidyl transferase AbiEii/AbiGii toxin family protein [bacterium]